MQESSYRLSAVNKRCGKQIKSNKITQKTQCIALDVGISQININTAKSYKFDLNRLKTDLAYSVDSGAKVLSWFKKTYAKRESDTWYCRYNTGTAHMRKIKTNCEKYVKDVGRWM